MASPSITFEANAQGTSPVKTQTSGSESTQRDDVRFEKSELARNDGEAKSMGSRLNFWKKAREGQKRYVCIDSAPVPVQV